MTSTGVGRPTVAAIDAAALTANFAQLRMAAAPAAALLAVVKADGYGHGASIVAPLLERAGADWFGVATIGEAVQLRQAGVRQPILVLTGAQPADLPAIVEHDLAIALLDRDMARALAAGRPAQPIRVHLKIDTGMGRIGTLPAELPALIAALAPSHFIIDGAFSHFANAESVARAYSDYQLSTFRQALAVLEEMQVRPRWVHLANSAATLTRRDAHFTMVRPGVALYGVSPFADSTHGLRPAMRLSTRIVQLKAVPSEFPVSYGQTFVTRRPSRIATLPIGYADGYSRALSNRACVLVRGQRAPVVGTVCMDLMMIDVTDVPAARCGDEVVLWGEQDGATLRVEEVAAWQGTISYELLTRLGPRVPRVLRA